ncbi:MAG: VTT domain-containing protein [Saprospiraceae bacterium]|jgi:membrane-associated protein|nr:VTT domain-containing protein [Saprospiraceae bacterium]
MDLAIDFILHTDKYLNDIVAQYGMLIYAVLFLVIFAETGFVVTPFLPGDGFLFTVGVIAGSTGGGLDLWLSMLIMIVAAISGNMVNFHIGRYFSTKLVDGKQRKWLNPKYLNEGHDFFEKHGQKAVILSRFFPIFRTFVPFVAGLSLMDTKKYTFYTFIGGISWVILLTLAGYFLGSIEFVKKNISFIVLGIIGVSLIPVFATALKKYLQSKKEKRV